MEQQAESPALLTAGPVFAAIVSVAALICTSAVAYGETSAAGRFLVVSTRPSSYRQVAHSYDRTGRLLTTVASDTPSTFLAWSPDGTLLAVADSNGVIVERPGGKGKRRLLAIRTVCTVMCFSWPGTAWSPDGKQLAVGGADPRSTGFVMVDVMTGRARVLARPRARVLYAPIGFSPDGKMLAYTVDDESSTALCACASLVVADADGSHAHTLVRFHDHHDGPGSATWSPDSTRIAFTEDGRDPRDPRIGVVNVTTGSLQSLDSNIIPNPSNVFDQSPAWSPDSGSLAFAQYHAAAFTIGVDGTGYRPLPAHSTQFTWLATGDLIFPTGATLGRIAILHANDMAPTTLFVLPHHEALLSLHESR
jgi:hypothetical protein